MKAVEKRGGQGPRRPQAGAAKDNPFVAFQERCRSRSSSALDKWRDSQEALSEAMFLVDLWLARAAGRGRRRSAVRAIADAAKWIRSIASCCRRAIAELKSKIGPKAVSGKPPSAALLYVGMARGMVDERSLEALAAASEQTTAARGSHWREFKMLVREQFFMLLLDREAALAAIPKLLPDSMDERRRRLRRSGSAVGQCGDLRRGRQNV